MSCYLNGRVRILRLNMAGNERSRKLLVGEKPDAQAVSLILTAVYNHQR